MLYRTMLALAVAGWLASGSARADHFTVKLEVKAGKQAKSATTDTFGLGAKPKERGVFEAKAGQTLTIKWTVESTAKQGMVKDVTIHFFVVKEAKVGQTAIPELDKDVPAEGALTMDFKPKDKSDGEFTVQIDTAGSYLIRVETRGAAVGETGHEHFAALDLVIK
jgi:hypothetical protein